MSKPTVAQLTEELDDLKVPWQKFAEHLPGITDTEINTIQENHLRPNLDKEKMALYSTWLRICPSASWDDVVRALIKVKEFELVAKIAKKYHVEEHEMETVDHC